MMLRNTFKYGIIGWITMAVGFFGCASLGPVVNGATMTINAAQTAKTLLTKLDVIYDNLFEAKTVPAKIQQATQALSIADSAAQQLRQVAAGKNITDENINVLAGQVAGAWALSNQMGK
jgi:hypothetical protein